MTTYYIDPSAATNGTGTAANPFNTWIGVPVAAGNVYKQKRGTTWSGAFPSLTSGTSGNVTLVASYANADGSDNTALPIPVIDNGDAMFPGTLGSPKTFMKFDSVYLKNNRSALASDTPMMWVGDDMEFNNVTLDTNLTGLYAESRNRLKIRNLTIKAATANSTTIAMNALVIAASAAVTGIDIDGLTVTVGDGGLAGTHAVKISNSVPFADLKLKNITVRTASGLPTTHVTKAGVFVQNVTGADLRGQTGTAAATVEISGIDVSNFVDGLFLSGVRSAWVHHCILNGNNSFGLHGTGSTASQFSGNIIEWIIACENGRNVSPFYGRGIELSGGGQLHACTSNVLRFFNASRNKNWGGPADNGTEGVGIGLDDATSFTLVYGGLMQDNEGQGVQFYGGSSPPADTGGNMVTGCRFTNNGLASIWNRRTGGTYKTSGACNISLGGVSGSRTIVAYNTVVGGFGGIRKSSECTNVDTYGNVFMSQTGYAISASATTGISNNVYKPGIPKNIGNLAVDANNSPAPALLSAGVSGDVTADPLLDANYMPLAGSPLLGRTVPWAPVPQV